MKKSEFKKAVAEATTIAKLKKLGFKKWNDGKPTLMLIPGKLFKSIPQGFPVVTISGGKEKFDKDTSDDDARYGCLAYGVVRNK